MQSRATVVITDSGGIQEESIYLGVPCLTLREITDTWMKAAAGHDTLQTDPRPIPGGIMPAWMDERGCWVDEPLASIYTPNSLPLLEANLAMGKLSLCAAARELFFLRWEVPIGREREFESVNYPHQLRPR